MNSQLASDSIMHCGEAGTQDPEGQEMAKKKTHATHGGTGDDAVIPAAAPVQAAPAEEPKALSKMEAVRQTLAAGVENPTQAVAHIKEAYGLEISTQVFSSYKATIKSKGSTSHGSPGRRVGRRPVGAADGVDGLIDVAEGVQELVRKAGADTVVRLAKLFGDA